jgi:DNA-binding NarL/FixJ family response regulator
MADHRPASPGLATELSHRDVELLKLLAGGLQLDVMARQMSTSERTVRRRIRAICDQLGVRTPIQAVAWAARQGLV